MKIIDFGQNCPLTHFLEEVSKVAGDGLDTQLASALLFGLGYPKYTQPPDITFTAHLLQSLRENRQNDLLSEATPHCLLCPQLDHCEIGALFKSV